MQTQKEYIRIAIVESARKVFLKKGFRKTSMRAIASGADVTLSNIYNYFPDKDALFREVFAEVLENLRRGQQFIEQMETRKEHNSIEHHMNLMDVPVRYVYDNRDMFELLLFDSEGSSLSDLPEEVTEWFARVMQLSVDVISERHGIDIEMPSESLMHYIGSIWVHFIMDSVRYHHPLEQIIDNGRQIMRFVLSGWSGIFGIQLEE